MLVSGILFMARGYVMVLCLFCGQIYYFSVYVEVYRNLLYIFCCEFLGGRTSSGQAMH